MTATAIAPASSVSPSTSLSANRLSAAAAKPVPRPPKTHHRATTRLISSPTVSPPAVRSVIVFAWADDGETGFELLPVLGIQSILSHEYSKTVPNGSYATEAPTHAELIRLGWIFEGTSVEHEPLIWFEEYQAVMPAEAALGGSNTAWTLVPCPWSSDEDEDRLLAAIKKTQALAAERDAEHRPTPRAPAGPAQ